MTDVIPITPSARCASGHAPSHSFAAPPPETEDPARLVGEIFKRPQWLSHCLWGCKLRLDRPAVLVALGKAALRESEMQAWRLKERTEPGSPGIKVTATARRSTSTVGTLVSATDPASQRTRRGRHDRSP